ncbi:hypothetical protein R3W88_033282 [Solanum pinnatisectum]|uniref:Uncharacterized protein n=1 Tax=Solanum pinnatisectum TaxID=50273 RepID=A0AAV9K2H4_9SOLN|nr:hypothetical protein R3W88_033282 [Solanum pinnatisectum]
MKQDTNYIPMNKASLFNGYKYNFFEDEYTDDDDVEMVLPHMIIKTENFKKNDGKLVCIGYGGMLKRRNLSKLKDSILRMISFIKT